MPELEPLHITPAEGGGWAIEIRGDAGPSSVHPTQAEAVANVFEMVRDREEAEVLVHDPDGSIRSSLTIRRYRPAFDSLEARLILDRIDDSDDPTARAEALRITPSNDRLRAGIGKNPPPPGNFNVEGMPCFQGRESGEFEPWPSTSDSRARSRS